MHESNKTVLYIYYHTSTVNSSVLPSLHFLLSHPNNYQTSKKNTISIISKRLEGHITKGLQTKALRHVQHRQPGCRQGIGLLPMHRALHLYIPTKQLIYFCDKKYWHQNGEVFFPGILGMVHGL